MSLFRYNAGLFEEKSLSSIEEFGSHLDNDTVCWLNLYGLHDEKIFNYLMNELDIHSLVLEDISNLEHRPKVEYLENYNFIILKMLYKRQEDRDTSARQVSLIQGKNYVISFLETKEDTFLPIRERIRTGKGRLRNSGADYLAYGLMDAITDNYFVLLEKLGDDIEKLEEKLMQKPEKKTLSEIHYLKRDLILLRHSIWPLREVISFMQREESPIILPTTTPYLRDLYDHTIQIMDTVESFRDMTTAMIDLYMSSVSNRMNEVVKVLTIISTIFIPISFVAGLYGMNFNTGASIFQHA